MAQDQSEVPEGRCGFEMLAGDVDYFRGSSLSEAVDRSRSAICWRQTAEGEQRCGWHAGDIDVGDKIVGSNSLIVIDGANIGVLDSGLSDKEVRCRFGDFSDAKIQNIALSEVDFRESDFSNADLRGCDLSGSILRDTNISEADLRAANLQGSHLYDTDLSRADISHANISGATMCDADLSEANLSHSVLSDADLRYANLSEVNLHNADLPGINLSFAQLSEVNLKAADLSQATLIHASLQGSDLTAADLSKSNLQGTDLSGSNVRLANFTETNLLNANAENVDFRRTSFGKSGADHQQANLEAAAFRNADLSGTDFIDARLDQIDLTDARIDAQTKFDAKTIYERDDDVSSGVRDDGGDAVPPSVWVHRRLERLHEENALSSVARQFHIRKQRARKRHYAEEANVGAWRDHLTAIRDAPLSPTAWRDWSAYRSWLQYRTFELTMGYGEQPKRVLATAGTVVGLWTLAYPFGDWIVPNPGTPEAAQRGLDGGATAAAAADAAIRYPPLPDGLATLPSYLDTLAATLADSLYFSSVTFTTLGFGDFSPVGFGRVLATVESALGVTLFAVLVFVLGRRATR